MRADQPPASHEDSAGGEMEAHIRAHDWSSSSLGPPTDWPQPLQTLMELMLASSQPMFLIWGPERLMLYNDSYIHILGQRHPAALGQPIATVWYDAMDQIGPIIDRAYRGISTHMRDIAFTLYRNGYPEETHFAFSYTPVRDAVGQVVGMFCACTETTDNVLAVRRRQEAEDALVRSENRLRLALDAAGFVGTWDWDVQNDCFYADARFARFYGADPDRAAHGAPLREFSKSIHPDDQERTGQEVEKAIRGRTPYASEYRVVKASGAICWVSAKGHVYYDEDDRPSRFPGVVIDITERKHIDERQKLMIHELNHRVKNTLATVQSLARQSFRKGVDAESEAAFEARLLALSTAHNLLTRENWEGAELTDIATAAAAPYCRRHMDGDRLCLDGPALWLCPSVALALSLVLHELSTNAAKYGALSGSAGRVSIKWTITSDDPMRLTLLWHEDQGPPVSPPAHKGFGTRLIERSLARELSGDVGFTYAPAGLVCTMNARLSPDQACPLNNAGREGLSPASS